MSYVPLQDNRHKKKKNTSTGTVIVGVFPLSLALHLFTFADGFERQEDNGLMWWCASRPTVESIDELAKMLSGHFGGIEATRKQLYAVPGVPELLARVVSIPKSKTPTDRDLSEDINAHNLAFIKKNMLGSLALAGLPINSMAVARLYCFERAKTIF